MPTAIPVGVHIYIHANIQELLCCIFGLWFLSTSVQTSVKKKKKNFIQDGIFYLFVGLLVYFVFCQVSCFGFCLQSFSGQLVKPMFE